jgi:hypothetical protein
MAEEKYTHMDGRRLFEDVGGAFPSPLAGVSRP